MIDYLRYYLLKFIDWKISLLEKFKLIVSGEYKYIKSDKDWNKDYQKWKKQND